MKKFALVFIFVIAIFNTSSMTAFAATYYISPSGNDSQSGTSPDSAWGTFERAWQNLYPGDTLILLDGIYYQSLHPNKVTGLPENPITIRAQNDGKVIIDGQGTRVPVLLERYRYASYLVIEGIVARNGNPDVFRITGDNNTLRRVSGYDANTDGNTKVISIASNNNLIEDCVASGSGRKMILIFKGENNTIRRCFAYWKEWDGRDRCQNDWPWGDNIEIYNASHNIIENSIGYGGLPSWSISVQANSSDASAVGNKVLGTMAVGAGMNEDGTIRKWPSSRPGSCKSMRDFTWSGQRVGFMNFGQGNLRDNLFQDIFAWGNAGMGFAANRPSGVGPQNSVISHATIVGNGLDAPDRDGGIGTNMPESHLSLYTIMNSRIGGTVHDGEGARLTHRYINGELTNEPLWPWPMEGRIQAELGFSVTERMLAILSESITDENSYILLATPSSLEIKPTQSGVITIAVNSLGSFDLPVQLDIQTNSAELKATPASVVVEPEGHAVITLEDLYVGTEEKHREYEIQITGRAGGILRNATLMAHINPSLASSKFSLTMNVPSIKVEPNTLTAILLGIEYEEGFAGQIRVEAEVNSSDLVVSPSTFTISESTQAVLEVRSINGESIVSDTRYSLRITATEIDYTGGAAAPPQTIEMVVVTESKSLFIPFLGR